MVNKYSEGFDYPSEFIFYTCSDFKINNRINGGWFIGSNNYRNKIVQNIMEDIKYDLESFDSNEMTMIQITLTKILEKYKFSPKEVTKLSLKNHNEEDINNYLGNMALSGCKIIGIDFQ